MAKLKVFRTPIGFHDAYVAAPSRKAALLAWGADANLFARGVAEEITDPKLMAAPLEQPGVVIKSLRGTAAEHLAALPRERARKSSSAKPVRMRGKRKAANLSPKPQPRPSRAPLDALEEEMTALEAHQRDEMRALKAEQAELDQRKANIERSHEKGRAALGQKIDRAKDRYQQALEEWRSGC